MIAAVRIDACAQSAPTADKSTAPAAKGSVAVATLMNTDSLALIDLFVGRANDGARGGYSGHGKGNIVHRILT